VLADEHGYDVPVRTVQHWASVDHWSERAREDIASIAPDVHHTIVSEMLLGAVESVRLLRQSVGDSVATRPDKTQVFAAFGLLDRAGYSPLGRISPVQPSAPPVLSSLPDIASLPLEDIERLETERLEALRAARAEALRARRKNS
jgi:hypothetical protein